MEFQWKGFYLGILELANQAVPGRAQKGNRNVATRTTYFFENTGDESLLPKLAICQQLLLNCEK